LASDDGAGCRKGKVMNGRTNREIAEQAFRDWQQGTGYITDLLAEDLKWTAVGHSSAPTKSER